MVLGAGTSAIGTGLKDGLILLLVPLVGLAIAVLATPSALRWGIRKFRKISGL